MIDFLRHQARAFRARLAATRYRNMGLQDVFEDIYGKNMWGGAGGTKLSIPEAEAPAQPPAPMSRPYRITSARMKSGISSTLVVATFGLEAPLLLRRTCAIPVWTSPGH